MRLIDADALLEDIRRKKSNGYPSNKNLSLYAESCVFHAPTIDAVKHGEWEAIEGSLRVRCSACKSMKTLDGSQPTHYRFFTYCPDCGAKMDLKSLE